MMQKIRNPKIGFNFIIDKLFSNDKRWISRSTLIRLSDINSYYKEVESDMNLRKVLWKAEKILNKSKIESKGGISRPKNNFLYALVRATKPKIVIESGVANGFTTLFILKAIMKNGHGNLISIDLPNIDDRHSGNKSKIFIPKNKNPGWIVPNHLMVYWRLLLGDSKVLLPRILKRLRNIGIFLHDSKHTYDHMMFEYNEVWPRIIENGFLISDDVDSNNAFLDFSKKLDSFPNRFTSWGGGILFKKSKISYKL